MAEAYRRKYGHEPSKRTRWLMGQQAAAMTRRPKSPARKIHGDGDGRGRGRPAGGVGGADRGAGDDRAVPGAP